MRAWVTRCNHSPYIHDKVTFSIPLELKIMARRGASEQCFDSTANQTTEYCSTRPHASYTQGTKHHPSKHAHKTPYPCSDSSSRVFRYSKINPIIRYSEESENFLDDSSQNNQKLASSLCIFDDPYQQPQNRGQHGIQIPTVWVEQEVGYDEKISHIQDCFSNGFRWSLGPISL